MGYMVEVPGGTYVVAVSGGVDSVALLHMLACQLRAAQKSPDSSGQALKLIVAHFDHGIRDDSGKDKKLVEQLARHYRLPFVHQKGRLGFGASEATARRARYEFLSKVRISTGAQGIITAHQQDDVIETVFLNTVRGTGPRGLHSLGTRAFIHRPLLAVPKKELMRYAKKNGLVWHEDSTNANTAITRNYIRAKFVADMAKTHRSMVLKHVEKARSLSHEIDQIVAQYLHVQPECSILHRQSFIELPHSVAREIMAAWLRREARGVELSKRLLERLVVAAKIGRSGSRVDVGNGFRLQLNPDEIVVLPPAQDKIIYET